MVLAVCQLLFHNFVFNCRFWMRLRCETCCKPTYNAFYYICCQCVTRKVCRDRCFTLPTILKWTVYVAVYGTTFFFVKSWNTRTESKGYTEDFTTYFDYICLFWAIMHPVFMLFRIPIFILYAIFTCCCDKGETLDGEFPYDKLFISFDYIEEHETEARNGQNLFQNPW